MMQVSINYIITFFKRLNEMDQISAETGCSLNPRGTPLASRPYRYLRLCLNSIRMDCPAGAINGCISIGF